MSDEITITLPVSGKKVVIRNYTTRGDDLKAEPVLFDGVKTKNDENGKPQIEFPVANLMASKEVYVRRLVQSIGDETKNIAYALEDLRTEDYEAIDQAVDKIVDEHSPKAQKVSKD